MMSRRAFVAGAGFAAGAVAAPGPVEAVRTDRPRDVGRKFDGHGRVMPFAGNTVICHLPQQGADAGPFLALLAVYRQLNDAPFAAKMTALPPSSYHMTIFGGANDKERRLPLWPADVPLDTPMDACNRILGDRLQALRLGEDGPPYRMKVDPAPPRTSELPLTIRLLPADPATRDRLYRLRARIADALRIGIAVPDRYAFHVTLGYTTQWLTPEEDRAYRESLARWKAEVAARVPVITLGAPEYCTLGDMFHFARQFYLS